MARDYEDVNEVETMGDEELGQLISQHFDEIDELDAERVDVIVDAGFVELHGRVGTEQELQQVEHVVTDLLGIQRYRNNLVVDPLVRGESPEAADVEAIRLRDLEDPQLGGDNPNTEPSAEHLVEDVGENLYGTRDMQEAIQDGEAYVPPDHPIQEGITSRENH